MLLAAPGTVLLCLHHSLGTVLKGCCTSKRYRLTQSTSRRGSMHVLGCVLAEHWSRRLKETGGAAKVCKLTQNTGRGHCG